MKWWMTAMTAVSVVGVLLLPGVRRHEPAVDASMLPRVNEALPNTNEALTVRPIAATHIESVKADTNENLVVVSRPPMVKPISLTDPAPAAAAGSPSGAANSPSNDSAPASTTVETRPVTITGCLEADHDRLLLKDTAGLAAPKSRSWKSGFFKKSSASIELVEPTHVLKLASYDGQRVSVSGTLDDREMHVHSVQRVETSCR